MTLNPDHAFGLLRQENHEEFATRSAVVSFCSLADVDARHRAVANVAVLLAKAGFNVGVCAIDSDPLNLYRYLVMAKDQRAISEPQPSAWDLINEFKAELTRAAKVDISRTIAVESEDIIGATIAIGSLRLRRPSNYLVKLVPLIAQAGLSGSIFVLPGGGQPNPVGTFDARPNWKHFNWTDFIENFAGAAYLSIFREDLLRSLNFLLISNDASFGESTRSATTRLADIVVLMMDYEQASMEQGRSLCDLLAEVPPLGWAEGHPPLILPVAGEVDLTREKQQVMDNRSDFAAIFGGVLPKNIEAPEYFMESTIESMPYFRYSRKLVTLEDGPDIVRPFRSYCYLARTIVNILGGYVRAGDAVDPARAFALAKARVYWDVFVSYASHDSVHARGLRDKLGAHALRAFVAADDITLEIGTDEWKIALDRVLDRSATLLLVVTPIAMQSPWVEYEWSLFLAKGKLIIPVCFEGPGPQQLPEALQRYHAIDCRGSGIDGIHLEALSKLISGASRHKPCEE
jgi:TIR domain-containing protein